MKRNVLLLEPNYNNKYPPIGLMKLATYFRSRGDNVVFYKGDLRQFMIDQIVEECILKLKEIDASVDWRLSGHYIAQFIKTRRREDLDNIGAKRSNYVTLITIWLNYYKDYYHRKEYLKHPKWDWIGVTTLFTFYWDITIETILFAKTMVKDVSNLMVGGVLASIQPGEIYKATGIKPFCGILSNKHEIDDDYEGVPIDELPLDYSILDEIDHTYVDGGAFFSYATRGCIRHCPFCAVPILEPEYKPYISISKHIQDARRLYGDQQNLLLMDNNVLASDSLPQIIDDIKSLGFTLGAKFCEPDPYRIAIRNLRLHINDRAYVRKCYRLLVELNSWKSLNIDARTEIYRLREKYGLLHIETCTRQALISSYKDFARYFEDRSRRQKGCLRFVDFNQGVDARKFSVSSVKLLSEIPVRPLRIAFDDIKTEAEYTKAIRMSAKNGIRNFSNYLLYNFNDRPEDLYHRLKINVELCEELDVSIYSFPMKYHPIKGENSHDRNYIGKFWNRKYIRAIQSILNATKGKIGRGREFFNEAFGRDITEFRKLLLMPETFIFYRMFFKHIGYTDRWWNDMQSLTEQQRAVIEPIIFKNEFTDIDLLTDDAHLRHILQYYQSYKKDIITPGTELHKLKQQFDDKEK